MTIWSHHQPREAIHPGHVVDVQMPQYAGEQAGVGDLGKGRQCTRREHRRQDGIVQHDVVLVANRQQTTIGRYREEDHSRDDNGCLRIDPRRAGEEIQVRHGAELQQPEEDGVVAGHFPPPCSLQGKSSNATSATALRAQPRAIQGVSLGAAPPPPMPPFGPTPMRMPAAPPPPIPPGAANGRQRFRRADRRRVATIAAIATAATREQQQTQRAGGRLAQSRQSTTDHGWSVVTTAGSSARGRGSARQRCRSACRSGRASRWPSQPRSP